MATIANGAGIGGAYLSFSTFRHGLGLRPQIAIGAALITEVFGFASGVTAHYRARTIDWKVARMLLVASVPMAVIGSLLGGAAPEQLLKQSSVSACWSSPLRSSGIVRTASKTRPSGAANNVVEPSVERVIVARDGLEYRYKLCRRTEGRLFAGLGGAFVGLISTGLGEPNTYALVKRCRVPSRVTVATSVVVVAVTALAASVTHLIEFVNGGAGELDTITSLVVFTVPGVIIGGQLGPQLSGRVREVPLIHGLGWLFMVVALVTLVEAYV
ncbi:MAG: sulfite exporter TauE/SafE family protein [Acidimicrobiia bacterium]|nr:sulfite exporter TauE/SafE family protein [Acidimicrobiia bacterium]MDH5616589.1 sulfite exporter TauE/SafE family protein [Acidimicrobiia bacterium]